MKKLLYLFLLIFLAACGSKQREESQYAVAMEEAPMAMEAKFASRDVAQASAPVIDRKLIKNGDISFETNDVKKTKAEIEAICKEFNAYISNESQNNFDQRIQYNQTVRVPANKFDLLIQRIEASAVKVESKNINTQDVTEEFIDVEARLKTKKELEARYREILKQAKTVQDIISIESQIANVRSEIESMEGRLNYLKNQVGFSTLNIVYYEAIGTDFGFASKFVRALATGWDNLLEFLIVLVNLWPFILLAAAFIFGIRSWRKRRKSQSST